MLSPDEIKALVTCWKKKAEFLAHNAELFAIHEGDLATSLSRDLQKTMTEETYKQIMARLAPINVLKKVVDKTSQIYQEPPQRGMVNKADAKLFEEYSKSMDLDVSMQEANRMFNLHKACAIEPYLDEGMPALRVVPFDRFLPYSNDRVNPTRMTHFLKVVGTYMNDQNVERTIFYGYSDTDFAIFDEDEKVLLELMSLVGNPNGENPVGMIPYVYVNRSLYDLVPRPDSDMLRMTKVIPILVSDLNYAVMYQSFSIIYGINVDEEKLVNAPNAFWRLKKDVTREGNAEVGVIKPEVDISEVIELIVMQFSFWLQSKNIRPGAVQVSAENFASGFSKMVDEMDTAQDRQSQVPFFVKAETRLYKLLPKMHDYWLRDPEFKLRERNFSARFAVEVSFPEQKPMMDEGVVTDVCIKQINAGLETREGALKKLHPDWNEEQIKKKLAEIEKERVVEMDQAVEEQEALAPKDEPQDDGIGNKAKDPKKAPFGGK